MKKDGRLIAALCANAWYYFELQFRQIFPYWVLGMVIGSVISVFCKGAIHSLFGSIQSKRLGALGVVPASTLGIASPLCMYGRPLPSPRAAWPTTGWRRS